MAFKPIQRIEVFRTLTTGESVKAGVLAQNRQGVFFQYDEAYRQAFANLSPFSLEHNDSLQIAPPSPHEGLHGVFADSLPDGWGRLLQDRVFRQQGVLPAQVTALDRLAFVGDSAIGALSFQPVSEYSPTNTDDIDLSALGLEAQSVFDGQVDEVLAALVAAGSSGGARPKAQVYFGSGNRQICRTRPAPNDEAWLVKFTSASLSLGHEEGLCEAVYLTLAQQLGLNPPEWTLLPAPEQSGASHWMALKRFDWVGHGQSPAGRLHMHSATGLLDADYRSPSLDYEDLIKASSMLCKSPAAGQMQFRRAIFNLFACNQDDHSKNWAFLQEDSGDWRLAPFYDVTFSPHPFGEHATAFSGHGKIPPLHAIQKLASIANFANWQQAREVIAETVEVISTFADVAQSHGVKRETISLIRKQLEQIRQANRDLYM